MGPPPLPRQGVCYVKWDFRIEDAATFLSAYQKIKYIHTLQFLSKWHLFASDLILLWQLETEWDMQFSSNGVKP